ncbi:MAG: TMEM175 family protein [Methanobrevibacter sp.]|uniref:TMEM175 family protein n=1 Tax=Methanobrevibacter sp. TaxID=66852 RepID=UPI002E779F82|nr:TMEM175 family protein [Methanobrevibacter sp.]MEE0935046.1 TMEM175 family protein [Methanobrevibacter sp.]
MSEINYMETGRLEAFYDAIIAIIVTVLVLELPQPASASLASIWAIKTSYFAYLISFLVCTNLWQYHHLIYHHVEKINAKVIWLNILLMLIVSILPYLTTFVANNPFSFLTQVLYGVDFLLINVVLFMMAKLLIKINPDQDFLKDALDIKNAIAIPSLLFIVGLVGAFLGYPILISVCILITIVRSILFSLR